MKVKRALISVSDKTGVVDFARSLHKFGVELISTGGTAKILKESNIPVTLVSDLTGCAEMLDGRVKTLHPMVHGGILAARDNTEHMKQLKEQGMQPIDLVSVNLYPFEKTISKEGVSLEEAIENIDIGGPTLVRAAAKNHKHVAVIVNPERYSQIIDELNEKKELSEETLSQLAVEAFKHTAEYDTLINQYLEDRIGSKQEFPEILTQKYIKVGDLRYGENPHQRAALYREPTIHESCVLNAKKLHGKQLSFNNILDLNDAFELVKDFVRPTAAVIKHTNPCGVASADTIYGAYKKAHETDPMSAFGCVVALNRKTDYGTAEIMRPLFIEAIISPGIDDDALKLLQEKKNIRILDSHSTNKTDEGLDIKKIVGGVIAQTRDCSILNTKELKVASKRKPTEEELKSMLFAWNVCRHVKSNSIVFAKDEVTTGIGAGQMSRVDAVKIAAIKSNGKSKDSVMASDAFFPFRDGIDEAARVGIAAVIQPGGSIRDQEVIDAVDEHGMAMVFTGVRCFKH